MIYWGKRCMNRSSHTAADALPANETWKMLQTCLLQVCWAQVTNWPCAPAAGATETPAQTQQPALLEPYILISGSQMCETGWNWEDWARRCISITDHMAAPRTHPLLIFTVYTERRAFLGLFFSYWPLIWCNYSSTKQMSMLRLPWRLDQATQQCTSFAGLHLYW